MPAYTYSNVSLLASTPRSSGQFGFAIASNYAGTVWVISEVNSNLDDRVHTYDIVNNTPVFRNTLNPAGTSQQYGSGLDLNDAGTVLFMGASYVSTQGNVSIMDWSGSAWIARLTLQYSFNTGYWGFGKDVGCNSSGSEFVIGVPYANIFGTNRGYILLFKIINNRIMGMSGIIMPAVYNGNDYYGHGAKLSKDGTKCIGGCPGQNKVHVHERTVQSNPAVLIMHFEDALDSSSAPKTATGVTLSSTNPKFGSNSLYMTGTGGVTFSDPRLAMAYVDSWAVDLWCCPTDLSVARSLFFNGNPSANVNRFYAYINTNGTVSITSAENVGVGVAGYTTATTTLTCPLNTYTHLRFVLTRSNMMTIFVNGVANASSNVLSRIAAQNTFYIGAARGLAAFYGYIDEFIVYQGIPSYADFSVPTAPLAGYGYTDTITWPITHTLTTSDAVAGDNLGSRVAISYDNATIFASMDLKDVAFSDQGQLVIFDWNGAAYIERSTRINHPEPAISNSFSFGMATASNGRLAVGAIGYDATYTNQGKVYFYNLTLSDMRRAQVWINT